jgi:hypothetical protein
MVKWCFPPIHPSTGPIVQLWSIQPNNIISRFFQPQYLTLPAEKTHTSPDMLETLLHVPILALMHSALCNDYQPSDLTAKWSSHCTIQHWLHAHGCSQSQSIGVREMARQIFSSESQHQPHLLIRINYTSNQGWVDWFQRIFVLGQRGPEWCRTRSCVSAALFQADSQIEKQVGSLVVFWHHLCASCIGKWAKGSKHVEWYNR